MILTRPHLDFARIVIFPSSISRLGALRAPAYLEGGGPPIDQDFFQNFLLCCLSSVIQHQYSNRVCKSRDLLTANTASGYQGWKLMFCFAYGRTHRTVKNVECQLFRLPVDEISERMPGFVQVTVFIREILLFVCFRIILHRPHPPHWRQPSHTDMGKMRACGLLVCQKVKCANPNTISNTNSNPIPNTNPCVVVVDLVLPCRAR